MNNNVTFTDKRLLEALDYIDESFIAEVTEDYKVYPTADEYIGDKKPHSKILRSLKYVAAVAACALLMSTLIPVVQYVSGNLGDLFAGMFGSPSDTSELTDDSYKIPEEHIENAPYFIFSPDLEPISAEKIEEIRGAFYQLVYDIEYQVVYESTQMTPYYANDQEKAVQVSKINADHNAKKYQALVFSDNAENHNTVRYYGTIEGYIILMMNTTLPDEYNVMKLGEESISNPTSFYLYAYKNQFFMPLEELYADSEISASGIELIAERHNEFNSAWKEQEAKYYYPKFTADLEELSDETINEIGDCFYNQAFEDMSRYQKDYEDMKKHHGGYGERRIREMVFGGLYKNANAARYTYFDKSRTKHKKIK